MNTQNQIGFISDKINQLQTAILHSHSNCLLKFPDSLVKTIQVDEVGCIWLAVKKPKQFVHEFDRSFHVALNYYRKGAPFYVNIFGISRLVIDPEEINQIPSKIRSECNKDTLLMSVRILKATYYENQQRKSQNILQRWKQYVSTLLIGDSNYYQFDMAEEKNYA
jgi:general stress protein 26